MKKTMCVPMGKECRFESLTCKSLVVDGFLRVDGAVRAQSISGEGFIQAHSLSARSIVMGGIDAHIIVTDRLMAEQVTAVEVRAVESAAISRYIEADLVKAGRLTLADSSIADLDAQEVIQLKNRGRGLLGTLLAAFVRASWTTLFHRAPKEATQLEAAPTQPEGEPEAPAGHDASAPEISQDEFTEFQALMADTEFQRIRAMYRLTRETDCLWQLIPKETPSDRAVHYMGQPQLLEPVEEVAA